MRVVLVPGVLALLPEYAGGTDPVAELRAACLEAVAWLGNSPVEILADAQGRRVARSLLTAAGGVETGAERLPQPPAAYLVVGNGSATRTEKAPGHLDERAAAFDDDLRDALVHDPVRLRHLDRALARELWADVDSLVRLGEILGPEPVATVDYDDDPFGVQYWVLRWES